MRRKNASSASSVGFKFVENQVEGHGKVQPSGNVEKVTVLLQWHDPSIEQFGGRHPLPTQVVQQQHAVVRAQLQRSVVGPARRIMLHVQQVQRELTAHGHDRAMAQQQALVVAPVETQRAARFRSVYSLVDRGIENLDHGLRYRDRVRNEHLAREQTGQPTADEGLAGAGGAVDEQRPPGVQCGSQLIEDTVANRHT
jgi:hypothetical protein